MGIKWRKCTFRITCRCKASDGHSFTGEQIVNGYVCAVDLHDSNRPWPIGIHKTANSGHLLILYQA